MNNRKRFSYGGIICNSLCEDSYDFNKGFGQLDVLKLNDVPSDDFEKELSKDNLIEKAYAFLKN